MLIEDHPSTHACAQSLIPVVMSGIIAVYGLVVSVLIAGGCTCIIFMDALLYITHLRALFSLSAPDGLHTIRRFHPPWCWTCLWIHGTCGRICNWLCRRLGALFSNQCVIQCLIWAYSAYEHTSMNQKSSSPWSSSSSSERYWGCTGTQLSYYILTSSDETYTASLWPSS